MVQNTTQDMCLPLVKPAEKMPLARNTNPVISKISDFGFSLDLAYTHMIAAKPHHATVVMCHANRMTLLVNQSLQAAWEDCPSETT